MTTPELTHRPTCSDPARVVTFQGARGDRMARCRSCEAIAAIIPSAATAETSRAATPSCNTRRFASASPTPAHTPEPAAPPRGYVCPDCSKRPSRDQRAGNRDGRCRPCWNQARSPRRKPVQDASW